MLLALLLAATVRGPADVESLTSAADAVVHGEVVSLSSAWAPGGGRIFTTVVLRTLETWKGEAPAQTVVLVAGGSVGELSQTVQGEAAFEQGEEVVVFLRRRTAGVFSVERLALGKFAVVGRRAVRERAGISCVGCAAQERDELGVDELRSRVLARARP